MLLDSVDSTISQDNARTLMDFEGSEDGVHGRTR